jgi:hypothetical protein
MSIKSSCSKTDMASPLRLAQIQLEQIRACEALTAHISPARADACTFGAHALQLVEEIAQMKPRRLVSGSVFASPELECVFCRFRATKEQLQLAINPDCFHHLDCLWRRSQQLKEGP